MPNIYFITGTDTDCGKTYCTVKLLHHYRQQGKSVLGLKPIASGCERTIDGLRSDDALKLQAASSIKLPYEQINPFAFEPAIAPHIAAKEIGVNLSVDAVIKAIQPTLQINCDIILIEGAGGVMVPLNDTELVPDLLKALNIPVIFVVGLKVGCINHALLSLKALKSYNIPIKDIIYNPIDKKMRYRQQNIDRINQLYRLTLFTELTE